MIAIHSMRTDRIRPALESLGGPAMIQPMLKIMGLSACTIKQHFSKLVLLTDDAGAEMARKCKFPYSEILSVGKNFDSDACFWTHSKFIAYANQQPFVHFDNDVFLWEPLPARLMEAEVFASNSETARWQDYSKHIKNLEQSIGLEGLHKKHFTNRMPINMSILGGNNFKALNLFSSYVTDFIKVNKGFYDLTSEQKNCLMQGMHVVEQLWGSCFIQNELDIKIELALSEDMLIGNEPSPDVKITHLHGIKQLAQNNPADSNIRDLFTKVNARLLDIAPEVALAIVDYGMVFDSQIGTNNDSNLTAEATHS